MIALVFPGQGCQFPGMGKELYETNPGARTHFNRANEILGFPITEIMFEGTAEELKETKVTQPAIFLHSVITLKTASDIPAYRAVAGHSLGEFSALVANDCLDWEDALTLVQIRADAMQSACEQTEGTMAAVIGLEDEMVNKVCQEIDEVVIPANYNSPGQIVISGSIAGIEKASEKLKDMGARRVLPLVVGGAFHSPLMAPAKVQLEQAISEIVFREGKQDIYQNVCAQPVTKAVEIEKNLVSQLISPVRWTQTIKQMATDGYTRFVEVGGNGKVLSGLIKRFDRNLITESL